MASIYGQVKFAITVIAERFCSKVALTLSVVSPRSSGKCQGQANLPLHPPAQNVTFLSLIGAPPEALLFTILTQFAPTGEDPKPCNELTAEIIYFQAASSNSRPLSQSLTQRMSI